MVVFWEELAKVLVVWEGGLRLGKGFGFDTVSGIFGVEVGAEAAVLLGIEVDLQKSSMTLSSRRLRVTFSPWNVCVTITIQGRHRSLE